MKHKPKEVRTSEEIKMDSARNYTAQIERLSNLFGKLAWIKKDIPDYDDIMLIKTGIAAGMKEGTDLLAEAVRKFEMDKLTKLYSRDFLHEILGGFAGESNGDMAVLMMDIDHFGRLNKEVSHHYGDQVLYKIAQKTQTMLESMLSEPENLRFGRYGGDEFVGAIQNYNRGLKDWTRILEEARHEIGKLYLPDKEENITDINKEFRKRTITIAGGIYSPIGEMQEEPFFTMINRLSKIIGKAKTSDGRNKVYTLT